MRRKIIFSCAIMLNIFMLICLKTPISAQYSQKIVHHQVSNVYINVNILQSKLLTKKISPYRFEMSNTYEKSNHPVETDNLESLNDSLTESTGGSVSQSNSKPEHNEVHKDNQNYVGRFKIPTCNIDVAIYEGNYQAIVDAKDSAAYFYGYKHWIIGDHNNQGFDNIKLSKDGTIAYIETLTDVYEYKCVAKINGHNTDSGLTDNNYTNIRELYPDTLVCYTCNDHWTNITLVFFKKIVTDEFASENDEPVPTPNRTNSSWDNCKQGNHIWGEWEIAWEVLNDDGSYYGWNKRYCTICIDEEWKPRTEPSENL